MTNLSQSDEPVILPEISEPADLFVKVGLYTPYRLDAAKISSIEHFHGVLDLYCLECGQKSIFTRHGQGGTPRPNINAAPMPREEEIGQRLVGSRTFNVEFECSRDRKHKAIFFFKVCSDSFLKVGQYPSRADIELPNLEKYRDILGSSYQELVRAVGLAAHGIGIGSFVYLRRIFEDLIESAHKEATGDPTWDDEEFNKKRWMDDKILMLKNHLPSFLVETRSIYGILSKGIHSLSESDCLAHFEPLRLGVELMLDEKLERKNKQEKIAHSKKAIASIANKLK